MFLWHEFYSIVKSLRPACQRTASFCWLAVALVAMCSLPDGMGVSSLVRSAYLQERCYSRLLHLFNGRGIRLPVLTKLWLQVVLKIFSPVYIGRYVAFIADGTNVAKEGKKMPAVKSLHNASDNNSKSEYIMGHSFEAISMLAHAGDTRCIAVPITSRINDGITVSNRERRTILDKLVVLFNRVVADVVHQPKLLIADAYYASGKVALGIGKTGTKLITRCKGNAVAHEKPACSNAKKAGRPKKYGEKILLREIFSRTHLFKEIPSPVYGDNNIMLRVYSQNLLWRAINAEVLYVWAIHPTRGRIVLMSTALDLTPSDIIKAYGLRFKIECGFKANKHIVKAYSYRFWFRDMKPTKKCSKRQFIHRELESYRNKMSEKLRTYQLYVQVACIAQGILQALSVNHSAQVWRHFRSWMRTLRTDIAPSEQVVAMALSSCLPEFLRVGAKDLELAKIMAPLIDLDRLPGVFMDERRCA
jgi:hypothetical protein